MANLSYDAAPFKVRDDLAEAHTRVWARLARAGTWLDGRTRIRIAEEARLASGCSLCAERKAALSPYTIHGDHDHGGHLPANWVDVIHRIATDPGRLTKTWYSKAISGGLSEEQYVETVGVIAHVTAVDTFARALGIPLHRLPDPEPGEPSHYRPKEAHVSDAWVPTIAWHGAAENEADLFVGSQSNIRRALTLVPDEARSFFGLAAAQYLSGQQMRDFSREYRAITHTQIELLASRISALNQCTY